MPAVLPGDLMLFARVIAVQPKAARRGMADRLLREAVVADRMRTDLGRPHPAFGDGSLVSRLMRERVPPLTFGHDPDLLHAMQVVARAVLKHNAS